MAHEETRPNVQGCTNSEESPQAGQNPRGLVLWGPVEKWGTLQPGVQPNFHNPAVRLLSVANDSLSAKPLPIQVQSTPVVCPLQTGPQPPVQPWQVKGNSVVQALHVQQNPVVRPLQIVQLNSVVQPLQTKHHAVTEPLHVQHHSSAEPLPVQQQDTVRLFQDNPVVEHSCLEAQDLTAQSLSVQTQQNSSLNLSPNGDNLSHRSWHFPSVQPLLLNSAAQFGQNQPPGLFGLGAKRDSVSGTHAPGGQCISHENVSISQQSHNLCSQSQEMVVPKLEPGTYPKTLTVEDAPSAGCMPASCSLAPTVQDGTPASPLTVEDGPLSSPIKVVDAGVVELWRIIGITKGFSTDADLAKYLLSVYMHFGDPDAPSSTSSSVEHGTQTDAHCSQCSSALSTVCVNMACQMSSSKIQPPSSQRIQAPPTRMSFISFKQAQPVGLSSSLCPPPTTSSGNSEMGAEDSTVISDHSNLEDHSDSRVSSKQTTLPTKSTRLGNVNKLTFGGNHNKGFVPMVRVQYLYPVVKLHRCDSLSFTFSSGYAKVQTKNRESVSTGGKLQTETVTWKQGTTTSRPLQGRPVCEKNAVKRKSTANLAGVYGCKRK